MKSVTTRSMWKRMFWLMMAVLVVGFGTIGVRLADIMLINGGYYSKIATEQQLTTTTVAAQRGNIYDRNMNILATSATVYTVYVTPKNIEDDEEARLIASGLSQLLELDEEAVYLKTQKNTAYEKIKQRVEQNLADEVRAFISDNKLGSVVGLDKASKRYYPNGTLGSTVLGFVGDDNQGLAGLEYQYDSDLTGIPGKTVSSKNARGSDMPFKYETMVESQPGYSVVSTLDEYIQHYAEKYLEEAVQSNSASNRGCCIVMNVNTGEILAMTTKGDYDPNSPFTIADSAVAEELKNYSGDEYTEKYSAALQEQWRNKAISDTYEPGSVFKIITGSAGLEEGKVSMDSTFNCPGYISIYDTKYNCHVTSGHGTQNLTQIFENSCNPAFIEIGQRLGVDLFYSYFKSFGFTTMTNIDLPGEATGIYYTSENMGPVELASESFGQTFRITPIQMITAVCAAANGGYLVKPHMVKQIIDTDGNIVKSYDTDVKRQVISESTSKKICGMLESVVANGTGKNGYVAGYRMAGKTGTSQKVDKKKETGQMLYIASFCGFAPADDPEIAVFVMVDEPHGDSIYGSKVSAPVAASIMSEALPYLGIEPIYTEDEYTALNVKVPSVIGSSIDEAKAQLEGSGFKVKTVGEGTAVVRQMPLASQTAPTGSTVVIYTDESQSAATVTVPDLKNLSVSEVKSAAKTAGVNLEMSGVVSGESGSVSYKQSVEPGTEVEAGTVVTVYFRYSDSVE